MMDTIINEAGNFASSSAIATPYQRSRNSYGSGFPGARENLRKWIIVHLVDPRFYSAMNIIVARLKAQKINTSMESMVMNDRTRVAYASTTAAFVRLNDESTSQLSTSVRITQTRLAAGAELDALAEMIIPSAASSMVEEFDEKYGHDSRRYSAFSSKSMQSSLVPLSRYDILGRRQLITPELRQSVSRFGTPDWLK
jgi:hypothetical protein